MVQFMNMPISAWSFPWIVRTDSSEWIHFEGRWWPRLEADHTEERVLSRENPLICPQILRRFHIPLRISPTWQFTRCLTHLSEANSNKVAASHHKARGFYMPKDVLKRYLLLFILRGMTVATESLWFYTYFNFYSLNGMICWWMFFF